MSNGRILINKNGQIFKTLHEEDVKLWPGSLKFTPCIKALCVINGYAQEVVILKKDLPEFSDITEQLKTVNDKYIEVVGDVPEESAALQINNKKLIIDIDRLKQELEKYKNDLFEKNKMIEEKDQVIDEFRGSPENIRKRNKGVDGIIESIRKRGRDAE